MNTHTVAPDLDMTGHLEGYAVWVRVAEDRWSLVQTYSTQTQAIRAMSAARDALEELNRLLRRDA
jgi:hypothetical protein